MDASTRIGPLWLLLWALGASPLAAQQQGGDIVLPNDAGQVWREYDISAYTDGLEGEQPQQEAVDWVLRETGTQLWFGEPLGILSASRKKLRVYHTAEVQQVVDQVVRRLASSARRQHALQLRLCTITSPNWRTQALRMLTPVAAQSPGVDAWLLSKDDAATLVGRLSRRADFRELQSPRLQILDGQPRTIAKTRPKTYIRSIQPRAGLLGPEVVRSAIDEGYTLRLSPLMSLDGAKMDAVIQCHIDQVEKLISVPLDYATASGEVRRQQIEVPQLVSWRLHERFRWPADQVLLLSCGVVAQPAPVPTGLRVPLPLTLPGMGAPSRADALLFVEVSSRGAVAARAVRAAAAPAAGARY